MPDAEVLACPLEAAEVLAEPPVEAPVEAEEPANEVLALVEVALELVDEAPAALLLEPEPDAADEEPELVKQLVAAKSLSVSVVQGVVQGKSAVRTARLDDEAAGLSDGAGVVLEVDDEVNVSSYVSRPGEGRASEGTVALLGSTIGVGLEGETTHSTLLGRLGLLHQSGVPQVERSYAASQPIPRIKRENHIPVPPVQVMAVGSHSTTEPLESKKLGPKQIDARRSRLTGC